MVYQTFSIIKCLEMYLLLLNGNVGNLTREHDIIYESWTFILLSLKQKIFEILNLKYFVTSNIVFSIISQ